MEREEGRRERRDGGVGPIDDTATYVRSSVVHVQYVRSIYWQRLGETLHSPCVPARHIDAESAVHACVSPEGRNEGFLLLQGWKCRPRGERRGRRGGRNGPLGHLLAC